MIAIALLVVGILIYYYNRKKKSKKKSWKFVALGDSLTYSVLGPSGSWTAIAAKATGIEIVNKGIPGDQLSNMIKRFSADVIAEKPTHCIISGGANDIGVTSIENTVEYLKQLIALCDTNGITPVFGKLIPVNPNNIQIGKDAWPRLDALRDAEITAVKPLGVTILDFYSPLLNPDGTPNEAMWPVGDPHPNIAGNQAMAAEVVKYIESL